MKIKQIFFIGFAVLCLMAIGATGCGGKKDSSAASDRTSVDGSAPVSDGASSNIGSDMSNFTVIPFESTSFFVTSNGDSLNGRDIPGGAILFKLNHGDEVEVLAVTQEYVTIDNIQDRWVKVRSKEGLVGWVFGGFLGIERSGVKYPGIDPDDPYDDGV